MRFPTKWQTAYAQTDQNLCLSFEYFMSVKLLGVSKLRRSLHRLF